MAESIVIVGAARTPMGAFQGDFSTLAAHDLERDVLRPVRSPSPLPADFRALLAQVISAPELASLWVPRGYAVVGLNVRSSSQVKFPGQVHDVKAAIRPDTKLISVMLANNEIGAIQPVRRVFRMSGVDTPRLLDYASALSEFSQRETNLRATQQTFARLQNIALFNYL